MSIPDYQSFMLPLLQFLVDGNQHTSKEQYSALAKKLGLTDDEMKEKLPSAKQALYENRIGWARTYLKKAGLIESPVRARFNITKAGLNVIKQSPTKIDIEYLMQFEEFRAFVKQSPKIESNSSDAETKVSEETPQEIMDRSYQVIHESLAEELLERIISQSPAFFENLVVELLVKMGYGGSISEAGKAIGKSGDEGIDGIIKEDKLGLDIIYIQAKRWKPGSSVGRPEIHKFIGALAGQGAKKGIFITTASFTKDAQDFQPKNETKIVLIDGKRLTRLMIDYGIGVSTVATYEIKKIDNDYFEEE